MQLLNSKLKRRRAGSKNLMVFVIGCLVWLGVLCGVARAEGSLSEYQVKALCLYNFAKYVDWPAESFAEAATPICIGVVGKDDFADALRTVVQGKAINGRVIAIQTFKPNEDASKCHILFVGALANKRLQEILQPIKSSPVLTVGEGAAFEKAGGVIRFVIRDNKVRFDIDVAAARQARLRISSKLLGLADAVSGKLE